MKKVKKNEKGVFFGRHLFYFARSIGIFGALRTYYKETDLWLISYTEEGRFFMPEAHNPHSRKRFRIIVEGKNPVTSVVGVRQSTTNHLG